MIDLEKKEYCLYSRYGTKNYLTPTEKEKVFKLSVPDDECIQVSYENNPDGTVTYYSVDPDGGPYITRQTTAIPLADHSLLYVEVEDIQNIDNEFYLTINIKNQ